MKPEKPLLRGHFHQAMFFIALGAGILLILKGNTELELTSTIIYSLGLLTMFGISALYHRINWNPKARSLMKRLDHSAIYVMIAGTFTPICLLALSEESGKRLLIAIWIVALFGIIQSIFFVNLPKMVSAVLYLIAGYMIAPYSSELMTNIGLTNLILIILGGVSYSVGAICYGLKKPVLKPQVFGYHEVFHLLVNLGAVFHFAVIYRII